MSSLRTRRGRSSSRDGGASLVEFALLLPLFVVLIFGMITAGIALSQQNSVKNAVREASRFAAVRDNADVQVYLADVIAQVENAATGDLRDTTAGKKICAAHTTNGTTFTSRTKTGSTVATGTGRCIQPSEDTATGARTQIRAERKTEIGAIFFTIPIDLEAQSVSRYERS